MPGPRRPADKEAFRAIVSHLENQLTSNAEAARTGPDHWQAQCKGRGHYLYICSSADSFGCGYCKVKGGPEELRALVQERREAEARKPKTVRVRFNPR